jgi:hypothetical protein
VAADSGCGLPLLLRPLQKIPSYSFAIVVKFFAERSLQKIFLMEYLTVEQPYARDNVDQEKPIGKHQELAQQDEG